MEVKEFQILEFRRGCGKQLLTYSYVGIHRSAHVEKEEQLHCIMPLRAHAYLEPALPRCAVDRPVDIQFAGRAFACEAASAAQCALDVARAKLTLVIQLGELQLVPYFDCVLVPPPSAAPNAFRILAVFSVRKFAAGPMP